MYHCPIKNGGFVDFMSFQKEGATIRYNGINEEASAFWEYLVSDVGALEELEKVPTAMPLITADILGVFMIFFLREQ